MRGSKCFCWELHGSIYEESLEAVEIFLRLSAALIGRVMAQAVLVKVI